jgi:hypothetical protein
MAFAQQVERGPHAHGAQADHANFHVQLLFVARSGRPVFL